MIKEHLAKNPLFVFALQSESANQFNAYNILYTGVGKINASYQLTKRIGEERPSIIINLGSAGSNVHPKGSVICCTQFVERDMDATMLDCQKYETPFSGGEIILNYGVDIASLRKGVCGTGDSFEIGHNTTDYNVIDMEAYALSYIAQKEDIPFICLKYISDGADDKAADEWEIMVHKAATALREAMDKLETGSY